MPVLQPGRAVAAQRAATTRSAPSCSSSRTAAGADMVLAMTHEEIVTMHVAQVVRSYRDLPLILYHFQTKERDEPRPRAGVLRTREFIMKDSYTFDRDAEGLDVGYEKHRGAYDRIFDRCGLEWYRVESDVGMMGGTGAHEYMAPCAGGRERRRARARLRRQRRGRQRRRRSRSSCPPALDAPEEVAHARARRRSPRSPSALGVPGRRAAQGLPGRRRAARAACSCSCAATTASTRSSCATRSARPSGPRSEDEFAERIGPAGYIGPVGADVPILLDDARRTGGGYVTGANQPDAPPARRRARARLPVRARSTCARSRPATPSTASRSGSSPRSRSATSSSSARATPSRSARPTSTRPASEQLDLDGLLRHRPGAHRRRRGRAVRRRAGHLVAALARAVGRRARRARQAGHDGARARRARSTTSCARPGLDVLYDDRDAGPGREVRRRRAARRARCG